MLLQVSYTTFSAVVTNQGLDGGGVQRDLGLSQAVGLLGLRREVSIGNGELLVGDVSADLQDFHSVEQGSRDRVEVVRRADEQDSREIDGDVHAKEAQG